MAAPFGPNAKAFGYNLAECDGSLSHLWYCPLTLLSKNFQSVRLLEHQGKTLLSTFGLPFNQWSLATNAAEVASAVRQSGLPVVIKAQAPVGGRAKAGAVKFAETREEAQRAADSLLGRTVRSHLVETVSVERRLAVAGELYVGIAWDTDAKLPVALLGVEGGVEVEKVDQCKLQRRHFDPREGLPLFAARELARRANLRGIVLLQIGGILSRLARAFLNCDAIVAEINPLAQLDEGEFMGLDAHVEIEDDALFRQQERLATLGDLVTTSLGRPPTPLEMEAERIDQTDHRGVAGRMVEFDGDLALLIGGGGASLTVFDAIERYGGQPANYCEIGGNPTEEKVAALTELLMSKSGVGRLAVIMNVVNNTRADVVARGVLRGLRRAHRKPSETISVFRVPGSWEEEAAAALRAEGIEALGREYSLDEAARRAVAEARTHVGGS